MLEDHDIPLPAADICLSMADIPLPVADIRLAAVSWPFSRPPLWALPCPLPGPRPGFCCTQARARHRLSSSGVKIGAGLDDDARARENEASAPSAQTL